MIFRYLRNCISYMSKIRSRETNFFSPWKVYRSIESILLLSKKRYLRLSSPSKTLSVRWRKRFWLRSRKVNFDRRDKDSSSIVAILFDLRRSFWSLAVSEKSSMVTCSMSFCEISRSRRFTRWRMCRFQIFSILKNLF